MTSKQKVLMIFGFHLAGVNYLVSDYLIPSLVCMVIAFALSIEMNQKGNHRPLLFSFGFSLMLNLSIFLYGSEMMGDELRGLVFKLALLQALVESGLLILLYNETEASYYLLKYAGSFFLILCFLIFLIPHEILDFFLYATIKGRGAISLFILCGEIFIPLILCSMMGVLYREMTIKKEPNHCIGSIK